MEVRNKILILFLGVTVMLSGCKDDESAVLTFEEQLEVDKQILDEYLADNNITAQEDPSGLRYVINELGDGATPDQSSTIRAAYEGTFLDGTVFDGSDDLVFPLRSLIEGWQIGIPLIQEGGDITLYIPSGLAYGTQGIPGFIPGNANLIFTIELIEIVN